MNNKLAFIFAALIGIGLYALPSTVALFAGQHSFTNIDPTGNQIDCIKCHGDVKSELSSQVSALTGTKSPHADMECAFCHRIETGTSSGDNGYAQVLYTGGGVSRKIALNLIDLEMRNIPTRMSPLSTYNEIINMTTLSGNNMTTKFSLSSCYSGSTTIGPINCNNASLVLLPQKEQDIKIYTLYENGGSIDKNVQTKNQAFDVSKITWNASIADLTGAGSRIVNSGSKYHAASLVSCLECHRGSEPTGHDRIVNSSDGTTCQPCHYGVITIPSTPATAAICKTCHTATSAYHHVVPPTYQCTNCHTPSNFLERDCNQCHSGFPFPSNPIVSMPTKPHHGDNGKACNFCHNGTGFTITLDAGGFGLTNNVYDTGNAEVHNTMMRTNDGNLSVNKYDAANSACIACHTHVDVEITYTRPTTLTFDANEGIDGTWVLNNYGVGPNTTVTHD